MSTQTIHDTVTSLFRFFMGKEVIICVFVRAHKRNRHLPLETGHLQGYLSKNRDQTQNIVSAVLTLFNLESQRHYKLGNCLSEFG